MIKLTLFGEGDVVQGNQSSMTIPMFIPEDHLTKEAHKMFFDGIYLLLSETLMIKYKVAEA